MDQAVGTHQRGIRINQGQFILQALQVFFVGLIIGMERAVLPALSADFGVKSGQFLFLASFVLSFGLVKGALNFIAGGLSDRIGRKPVLLAGWIAALPIPLLIFFAPNWWWIIPANIFLGINQGLIWTMTVTSQIDIASTNQRGLAVGTNEATGYVAVGLAGLGAAYLAQSFGPRSALLGFGLAAIATALVLIVRVRDTSLGAGRTGAGRCRLAASGGRGSWRGRGFCVGFIPRAHLSGIVPGRRCKQDRRHAGLGAVPGILPAARTETGGDRVDHRALCDGLGPVAALDRPPR